MKYTQISCLLIATEIIHCYFLQLDILFFSLLMGLAIGRQDLVIITIGFIQAIYYGNYLQMGSCIGETLWAIIFR